MLQRFRFLFLSIASGLMLYLGWSPRPFVILLLAGLIPLLIVEHEISLQNHPRSNRKVFLYSYLSFTIWNVLTCWWVGNTTSPMSGVFANLANPMLMCLPFLLFHVTKKKLGRTIGYISLIAYWLSFEFLHLRWELTWPWLTLGNGFASFPSLIQWYEFTGVEGGTLWIWLSNIFLFQLFISKKFNLTKTIITCFIVFQPILISLIQYNQNEVALGLPTKNVVVVQPNIDPYNEKFDRSTLHQQIETLKTWSEKKLTDNTDYLVWPETALPQGVWLNDLDNEPTIKECKKLLHHYPNLHLVTGADAYEEYNTAQTVTARPYEDSSGYYDAFNCAFQIDNTDSIQVYKKSKLVPGVERMPYPGLLKFLQPLTVNMGGITGSLGTQEHRGVFFSKDSTGVAPVICYESIFGEYLTEYIRNGAGLIFIITNDGWWGNTDGHLQHLHYASLAAIETRRCIARSANTGTSCFIDMKGNLYQQTDWWQPNAISATLSINHELTFYVKHGDYIARIGVVLTLILFVLLIINKISPSAFSKWNLQ